MSKKKEFIISLLLFIFVATFYIYTNKNEIFDLKYNGKENIENNSQSNNSETNDTNEKNNNGKSTGKSSDYKPGGNDSKKGSITPSDGKNGNVKKSSEEDENGNKSILDNNSEKSIRPGDGSWNGTVNMNGSEVADGEGNASPSGSGITNNSTGDGNYSTGTTTNGGNNSGGGKKTGTGTGSGSNSGPRYETYNDKVSIQNNTNLSYVDDPTHDYNYNNVDDGTPTDSIGIAGHTNGAYTLENNDKKKITITLNLLNAPYDNKEYCEAQLDRQYEIVLDEDPGINSCENYPTTLTFDKEGTLNVENHRYTKKATLDFSNTKFKYLGDYYFDIKEKSSGKSVYQLIVSFRNDTDEDGHPLSQTQSIVQLKSMATGTKVQNMNINLQNANTFITLEQLHEKNGIDENFYVDLIIDSYNNELYSVLDGNEYDKEILSGEDGTGAKIGSHIIIKDGSSIVNQTYRLTNGGKILIGQGNGQYQIPVGTKYKILATNNKNYREKYELSENGDYRMADIDSDENMVTVTNITKSNPHTGLYYTIIPFVILIITSGVGIIIIKKLSIKKD